MEQQENQEAVDRAHRFFAPRLFNQCWEIIEKENRSEADLRMLEHLAHASMYHWLQIGKPINDQRGAWMLSRVYVICKCSQRSLLYAQRCLDLTEEHGFKDFDLAYAYEAMWRAHKSCGNTKEAEYYRELALEAGEKIAGKKDREIFGSDMKAEF